MKNLLLLWLLVPAFAWATEGKSVSFSAQCFNYADFIKKIEFFEEVPIMLGVQENSKDKTVLISVLYNQKDDSFSIVQFNKTVGCFLTVGRELKFNLKGLTPKDIK